MIQVDNILDKAVGEVKVPLLALLGPAEEKAWPNLFPNGIEVVNAWPHNFIILKVVVGSLLEPLSSLLLRWLWGLIHSVRSVTYSEYTNCIFKFTLYYGVDSKLSNILLKINKNKITLL